MSDFRKLIEDWFRVHGAAGLVLPDGWFGRPHDNIHQLSFLAVRPAWLILEFDERLLLTLRDVAQVAPGAAELEISGFSSCVFDWKEYVNDTGHVRRYEGGAIRLVGS